MQAGTISTTKNTDETISALLSISSTKLNDQLQDSKASVVTFDISDIKLEDYKQLIVSLDKELASSLLSSGKGLTLTSNEFAIDIPAGALSDFVNNSGFKLTLSKSNVSTGISQFTVATRSTSSTVSSIVTVGNDTGKLNKPIFITLKPDPKNW